MTGIKFIHSAQTPTRRILMGVCIVLFPVGLAAQYEKGFFFCHAEPGCRSPGGQLPECARRRSPHLCVTAKLRF
jgi:hypothetical protein